MKKKKLSLEGIKKRIKKKKKILRFIKNFIMLMLGAVIYTIGLDMFLVPNDVIDGGVVGISLILRELTGQSFSIFLVVLNVPFLYLGYKQIGKTFAVLTTLAILAVSFFSSIFILEPKITNDIFLATVFGGIITGFGVGLIIRYGGSLDGSEVIGILMERSKGYSVGQTVMFINLFILGSAGFVFGWDKAMYSLVAYFIIAKVMDIVIQGTDESKAVMIVTDKHKDIAQAITMELKRGVTILQAEGGYTGKDKKALYCAVSRLEVNKLKDIILDVDENAFATVIPLSEIVNGTIKEKKH